MKAAQIDAALKQLAYEIAEDTATYDTLTAALVMHVIDRFIIDAPTESKERLFDILKEKVLPSLMMDRSDDQPLRIWIPACSTGEEAYSISMLVFEIMSDSGSTAEFQIFASDIDQEAIHTARRGIYPKKIVDQIDPDRLKRFFIKVDNGYQICRLTEPKVMIKTVTN